MTHQGERHHQIGRAAESHAAAYLEAHGYRLLERNWRIRGGEIDLIVEKAGVLCFVEVRTRGPGARVQALESVDARKRSLLVRAAQEFLVRHRLQNRRARFDVVAVATDGTVSHLESAFTLDE
jgi:putative endonuclease